MVQVYDQNGTSVIVSPTAGTAPVTGEGLLVINFPFAFTEKPVFTYGHELAPNNYAVPGAFPGLSATVHAWTTRPAGGASLWMGAIIGFVVTGSVNQKSLLHYNFCGKAMQPVSDAYNDTGSA